MQFRSIDGLRIIFVHGNLAIGGSEMQSMVLARYLKSRGARVQMWGLQRTGELTAICEQEEIPWHIAPVWGEGSTLKQAGEVLRFAADLRRAGADVILPYTLLPNTAAGLAWRLAGAKRCIWNQRDKGIGRFGQQAVRWAVRNTPVFVSNSAHGADFLVNTLQAPREHVHVVHNGVELAPAGKTRPEWRAQLEVGEDDFLACMVANLSGLKDHETLLMAWRIVCDRLQQNGRRAYLVLAGRFDDAYYRIKALAYDLKLYTEIKFLGSVDDISGLLHAVDLGVFSSKAEGSPNGLLECMAAGLATAGTDIPGIRETVGEGGIPWLAPVEDYESLAGLIITLANDAGRRAALGESNRLRIEAEYAPQLMCERMAEIILRGY